MGTRKVLVMECDLCKADSTDAGIETHVIAVDGQTFEFESCLACWQKMLGDIAEVAKAGRKPAKTRKVSQGTRLNEFPDMPDWSFTAHALERLGQRHITPVEAYRAALHPDLTRPGNQADLQIRVCGKVKALVDPTRQVIVTVAREDEELDAVR